MAVDRDQAAVLGAHQACGIAGVAGDVGGDAGDGLPRLAVVIGLRELDEVLVALFAADRGNDGACG